MSDSSDRYAHELLEVCSGLHGSNSGASDPLPDDEVARLLSWLRSRLAAWYEGHALWADFDDAVRALVEATIRETERRAGYGGEGVACLVERAG